MNVLGIDLSSKAIDLVLLDENANRAEWTRIDLEGPSAFERARDVAEKMPRPGWYEAHGVYLVAIEEPMGFQSRFLYRIQGAVLAEIPRGIQLWQVRPASWKNAMGLKQNVKPGWHDLIAHAGVLSVESTGATTWTQDARDALGLALYARDTNARGVAEALGAA